MPPRVLPSRAALLLLLAAAVTSSSRQDYIESTWFDSEECSDQSYIAYKTFRKGGCQSRESTACLNSSAFVRLTWQDDACSVGSPIAGPVQLLNIGCTNNSYSSQGYREVCTAGPLILPLQLPGYATNSVGDSYDNTCTFSPSKSLDITAFPLNVCLNREKSFNDHYTKGEIYDCDVSKNTLTISLFDASDCRDSSPLRSLSFSLNNCSAWLEHDFYWACGQAPAPAPSSSFSNNTGAIIAVVTVIVVAIVAIVVTVVVLTSTKSWRNLILSCTGLRPRRKQPQQDAAALPLLIRKLRSGSC